MDKEEILKMEAGGELNALIDKKIFGGDGCVHDLYWVDPEEYACSKCHKQFISPEPWSYSTDISAAWQVVERVCNWAVDDNMLVLKGQALDPTEPIGGENEGWWEAEINGTLGKIIAEAKTAPEAICKAALLAKSQGGK